MKRLQRAVPGSIDSQATYRYSSAQGKERDMLIAKGILLAFAVFIVGIVALLVWGFVASGRGGSATSIDVRLFVYAGKFLLGIGLGVAGIGAGVWILAQLAMSHLAKLAG
jgi:hypothetical protein